MFKCVCKFCILTLFIVNDVHSNIYALFKLFVHFTMTNKGTLNLSLSLSSLIEGHRCPSSALAPPLFLFPHTRHSAPPGAASVSGALTSLRDPCGDFVAARPAGTRRRGSRYEPQTFPFSPSQHKSVYRVGVGGGTEGVDPVACESSVPSESVCVRVCLCVHWILLHCSPLSVSASWSDWLFWVN